MKDDAHDAPYGNSSTREQLGAKARDVAADVGELGQIAREAAESALRERLDDAKRAAAKAREKADETKQRASELEDRFEDWIRDRPLRSVLIAMGVGALAWSFLRRS